MRNFLESQGCKTLPVRVLPEPEPTNIKIAKETAQLDATLPQPLDFDKDGQVVESVITLAHDAGFSIGSKVLSQGKLATIVDLTHNKVTVKVDGEDKAKVVPFKQLVVPEKAQKVIQPEAARDKRMPAQDWAVMTPAGADSALNMWVQLGLFHAHSVCSPNMQIVRLHDENGVETWSLEKDVKERMLILVPYSSTFEFVFDQEAEPLAKKAKTDTFNRILVKYNMKGETTSSFVTAVAEGCDTLFWKLLANDTHRTKGHSTLHWRTATLEVPIRATYMDKDKSFLKGANQAKALVISFPYLTNTEDLTKLTILTVPDRPPPDIF